MISLVLSQTDLLLFPKLALILFFTVFALMLGWVFRPGSRSTYEARSRLVFSDSEEGPREH